MEMLFKFGFNVLGWTIPILYEIFLTIDALIYEIADQALRSFFKITLLSAEITKFSTQLNTIMNRIMVLAGVFALFRLGLMLINYILDPSKIDKAKTESSSIIKNIIIAVVLLIVSPIIFNYLGEFQARIIKNGVIPKLVYGTDGKSEVNNIENDSTKFVNNVFLLFFTPSKEDDCKDENRNHNYCVPYINVSNGTNRDNGRSVGIMSLLPYVSSGHFQYTPFISGIVGMMLIYYFVVYSVELGARIIKLAVLQVVSPIPIISSIDPSQKDKLTKFFQAYSSLYLQVFLRIITVYLAFVVLGFISQIDLDALVSSGMLLEVGFFIKIILYFGVFHAAKELPKLLEEALGLKGLSSGGPGKGFGALVGAIVGGTTGLVGGSIAGAVSGGIGGAVAGGLSGLVSGGGAGVAATKNVGNGVKAAVASVTGSYALGGKVAGAGGLIEYTRGGFENFFGAKGKIGSTLESYDTDMGDKDKAIEKHQKAITGFNKDIERENTDMSYRTNADQLRGRIESALQEGYTGQGMKYRDAESYIQSNEKYQELLSTRDYLNSSGDYNRAGASGMTLGQENDRAIQSMRETLSKEYERERQQYFEDQLSYYSTEKEALDSGTVASIKMDALDDEVRRSLNEYNDYVREHGMGDREITTYNGISVSKDEIAKEISNIQANIQGYQGSISKEEMAIKDLEREKADIKKQKETFEESRRRNLKRDEKPKPKPYERKKEE